MTLIPAGWSCLTKLLCSNIISIIDWLIECQWRWNWLLCGSWLKSATSTCWKRSMSLSSQTLNDGARATWLSSSVHSSLSTTHKHDNMQLKTADFTPSAANWRSRPNIVVGRLTGAAIWQTRRNIYAVFDSGLCPALYEDVTSSRKLRPAQLQSI